MKKLYYLVILYLFACNTNSELKFESTSKKESKNKNVIITGTSDEKGFDEKISLHDYSLFYVGKYNDVKKEIIGNKVIRKLYNIKSTKLLKLNSFGKNKYYRTYMIVTPGDSISYTLKNGRLRFNGKNEAHYNFYLELDKDNYDYSKLYLNKYNPDFKTYKQQCDSLYNSRISFFNNYIQKYPNTSKEFRDIVKEDLYFEYLYNLIKPRTEIQSSWTINTQEDIMNIYDRANKKEGEYFDMKGYLNHITLEEVNQPKSIRSLYFQVSIVELLRQYFVKSSNLPYSIASLKEELIFLRENFHPTIVEKITARLIKTYFDKGFGKDENTYQFFKETIANYKKTVTDSNIIEAMEDVENELSSINKIVPKDLNELVLNLSRDTVDFKFALHKKSIKVIDFWASWCGPCIEEIITSNKKRERLKEKYDIDFIYISTDKDIEKWITKSLDLYEYLPGYPQYKLLDLKKSKLIKYLNLKSSIGMAIPRYVILDENNVIIDNNAPKPSDERFEEVFLK